MRNFWLFLIVALLVTSMAGCVAPPTAEEAQEGVEAAESAVCNSIKAYAASLDALQEVNADTTVEEFNGMKEAVGQAYDDMVAAWSTLQATEVQAVESAVNDFQNALNVAPAEATLGEVANGIQESAAVVRAAVDQLDQTVCVGGE
jgi:predicted lipoprotein